MSNARRDGPYSDEPVIVDKSLSLLLAMLDIDVWDNIQVHIDQPSFWSLACSNVYFSNVNQLLDISADTDDH